MASESDDVLEDYDKLQKYLDKNPIGDAYKLTGIKLPEGNWQLLARLNDLTDEDCEPLVEHFKDIDYKYAFEAFLLSKHINVESNHLILKR